MRIDHIDSVGTGSDYNPSIQDEAQVRGVSQAGDPPPTTPPTKAELDEKMRQLQQRDSNLTRPLAPWVCTWRKHNVGLRYRYQIWQRTEPPKPGLSGDLINQRREALITSCLDDYKTKNPPPSVGSPEYEEYMDKLAQYERVLADDPNINAVASDSSFDTRQHGDGYNDHKQGGRV